MKGKLTTIVVMDDRDIVVKEIKINPSEQTVDPYDLAVKIEREVLRQLGISVMDG